jgi:hypothetical protein
MSKALAYRAVKLDNANGDEAIHATDKRVLQEVGEPKSNARIVSRVLQLRADSLNYQSDTRDGSGID